MRVAQGAASGGGSGELDWRRSRSGRPELIVWDSGGGGGDDGGENSERAGARFNSARGNLPLQPRDPLT